MLILQLFSWKIGLWNPDKFLSNEKRGVKYFVLKFANKFLINSSELEPKWGEGYVALGPNLFCFKLDDKFNTWQYLNLLKPKLCIAVFLYKFQKIYSLYFWRGHVHGWLSFCLNLLNHCNVLVTYQHRNLGSLYQLLSFLLS